jgi:cytochrome b6-f complex iron-sulfur subunit
MEREEFLAKLGIGALTICVGSCLASCGKGGGPAPTTDPPTNNPPTNNPPTNNPPTDNNPPTNNPPTNNPPTNNPPTNNPPTNNPPANNAIFTVDLDSSIKNVGDSTVSNGIILARIATGNAAGSFVAVQVTCTHEGGTLGYNGSQGLFVCPLHGSVFSKSGSVVQGPATTSLRQYNIGITGSTLSVTA